MPLLQIALAPTIIILFYVFIRDKYEKEPIKLLLLGVLYGVIIAFPIVQCENLLARFMPDEGIYTEAFYTSFAIAAFVEESFKFTILYFLIWNNFNYNEKFDGIVYSVFISLGFAGFENILYVFNTEFGGINTALSRTFISVPGHALFGVAMGYYLSMAKFEYNRKVPYILKSYFMPIFLHGTYDFILLANIPFTMAIFIPFIVYLWISGFRKMKKHINESPFRDKLLWHH